MNIIERFKEFCYRLEMRQKLSELNERRQADFMAYSAVKSVLLLYESEWSEQNYHVVDMVKALETDGKKVTCCLYVDKKQAISSTLPQRIVLDQSHTNWFGKPEELTMRSLTEQHFDVLIDVSSQTCRPLKYALLYANASMKCGLRNMQQQLYDFTIDLGNQEPQPVANGDNAEENSENSVPLPTPEEQATKLFSYIHHYLKTFI